MEALRAASEITARTPQQLWAAVPLRSAATAADLGRSEEALDADNTAARHQPSMHGIRFSSTPAFVRFIGTHATRDQFNERITPRLP